MTKLILLKKTAEKEAEIIEKLRTLEDGNRRNNLRIKGISENKNETWKNTTEKVQRLFSHRLGGDRTGSSAWDTKQGATDLEV